MRNLDILKVLDQLTNDNLYFLQMYFTHPEKEIFNYNKFSKTEEDGELIQKALDKFMSLTSYKFKEAIALISSCLEDSNSCCSLSTLS